MSTKRGDYEDAFVVPAARADRRSPEVWARATFEDRAAWLRVLLLVGWRAGLLLRMRTGDPDRVFGWEVVDRRPDAVTIEAAGPLLSSQLTFLPGPDAIRATTVVRYRKPAVGLLWRPVAVLHRRLIPAFLRRAARSLG